MMTAFILPGSIINIILFMEKNLPNPIGYGWATLVLKLSVIFLEEKMA